MTLYERISPVYEAVEYKLGMEDGFRGPCPYILIFPARGLGEHGINTAAWSLDMNVMILTNTETGEREIVPVQEFQREFKAIEGK